MVKSGLSINLYFSVKKKRSELFNQKRSEKKHASFILLFRSFGNNAMAEQAQYSIGTVQEIKVRFWLEL